MADCPSIVLCPFFNDKMTAMPKMAELYKKKYCKDAFDSCARKIVAAKVGREKVPGDLFPNQRDKAMELLKGQ